MVDRHRDARAPGLGDQLGRLLDRLGPAVGGPPLARAAARAVDGGPGGAQLDRDAAPGPPGRPGHQRHPPRQRISSLRSCGHRRPTASVATEPIPHVRRGRSAGDEASGAVDHINACSFTLSPMDESRFTAGSRSSRARRAARAAASPSSSAPPAPPSTARAAAPAPAARPWTGPRRSRRPPSSSPRRRHRDRDARRPRRRSDDVAALAARIDAEHGGLDVLVNDVWGGDGLIAWNTPFWEHDLQAGLGALRNAIDTHVITSWHAAPLLRRRPGALLVEVTDGNDDRYRGNLFYDLAKDGTIRLARAEAAELAAVRRHRHRADAGLPALGGHARPLRRHRGDVA